MSAECKCVKSFLSKVTLVAVSANLKNPPRASKSIYLVNEMEKNPASQAESVPQLRVRTQTHKFLALAPQSTQEMLAEMLESHACELLVAENQEDGLRICQNETPAVLLLDLPRPEVDGAAFLQSLLAQGFPPQSIVVLLEEQEEQSLAACERLAVQGVLMKPLRPERLRGQVMQVLEWVQGVAEKQHLQNRFMAVLESISAVTWECDNQLCFSDVSDNVESLLGYSPDEMKGQPLAQFLSEAETTPFTENMDKLTEALQETSLHFIHQNGEAQLLETSVQPIFDAEGQPVGVFGISCRGVERGEELPKAVPEASVRVNEALELIYADASAQEILGLAPEDLPCNFIPYLADGSLQSIVHFSFMQKEEIPFPLEVKVTQPSGKVEQFQVHFHYHEAGPFLEGSLRPADSAQKVEAVNKQPEAQTEELDNVVVIDEEMERSIVIDIQNLAQEILDLLKILESFEYSDTHPFNMEEIQLFLQNKNIAEYRENVRLLSNKIHGLKGNSGFLIPAAKKICHDIENITSPLAECQLVLTTSLFQLLKQFIFEIQDIVEKYQKNPETKFESASWLKKIEEAHRKAKRYIGTAQHEFAKMLSQRSIDKGDIRSRKQEYLSVSQEGYLNLSEQMKSFFYLVSEKFANEDLIEAGRLYNEFMSTHQTIKKVPVNLSRYERLVPSIAKQYGKQAHFIYKDHAVLADQEFWNGLHEILNHCLKNAVTHGIELPAERQEERKDKSGNVSVEIQQDSLSIYVQIADDGKGIEVNKIVQKVVEQGIHSAEQLAQMPPSEVLKLVFVQGVSTAEAVDDNAGRGVGMNAVQEVVSKFRGDCHIESTAGQGTSWSFVFPKINVSLACFIVALGEYSVAIPDTYVATFQDHHEDKISEAHRQRVFTYDGNYFPLIDTEKIFQENVQLDPKEKKSILLLKNQEHFQGLLINRVLHYAMLPILNLPDMLQGNKLYLGVTLYGQEPVLVLNVEKLFSISPSASFKPNPDQAFDEAHLI